MIDIYNHDIYQINNIIEATKAEISDKQCLLAAMQEYRVEFIKHTFYYQISTYLYDSYKWMYDKDVNNLEEMRRLKAVYELLLNELRTILCVDIKIDAVIPLGEEPYGYKIVFAVAKKTIAFIIPNVEMLKVDNILQVNEGQLALVNETDNEIICKSYEVDSITKAFQSFVASFPAKIVKGLQVGK